LILNLLEADKRLSQDQCDQNVTESNSDGLERTAVGHVLATVGTPPHDSFFN